MNHNSTHSTYLREPSLLCDKRLALKIDAGRLQIKNYPASYSGDSALAFPARENGRKPNALSIYLKQHGHTKVIGNRAIIIRNFHTQNVAK